MIPTAPLLAAYVPSQLRDQADRSSQRYYLIDNVVWFDGELPRANKHGYNSEH
jgi:hypothetical protein